MTDNTEVAPATDAEAEALRWSAIEENAAREVRATANTLSAKTAPARERNKRP